MKSNQQLAADQAKGSGKARPKNGTPLPRSKFQFFPPHPLDRHEALKTSITHHGVESPITYDDQGNLLDGWERETICKELGVTCPKVVRQFGSEAEKFQFVLAVNAHRRPNLNEKQKREVIASYLKGDPGVADNMLGDNLGVSKNTVFTVRQRLETSGEIQKVEKTTGKDGKLRPVKYTKRIITNTPNEFARAKSIIKDLPDKFLGKTVDMTTARRQVRKIKKKNAAPLQIIPTLPDNPIQLYNCRFQDLPQVAGLVPGSVRLVCTDFPYEKDFLPQLDDLARFAATYLAEGGLLVSYTGKYDLDQVMRTFGEHLKWRWMICSPWEGKGSYLASLQVESVWKPILVYSKGDWLKRDHWLDLLRNPKEKDRHDHQQPLAEVETLVRTFSQPGDLVVDPCAGSFTTAAACVRLGDRRCISCDVDTDCVRMGLERLEQERRPSDINGKPKQLTQGNEKVGDSPFVFNLPAKETCPGKSPSCEAVCYADKGNYGYRAVIQRLQLNLRASESQDFVQQMTEELGQMTEEFRSKDEITFRIHSSGDFYSAEYIRKWVEIVVANPQVTFWAYTRSWRIPELLEELKHLANLPNILLSFSCDQDTGLPPQVEKVRACWLQVEDEVPLDPCPGETPVELVFRTDSKNRPEVKRIGLALVCPKENGSPDADSVRCESCKFCFTDGHALHHADLRKKAQ